MPKRDNHEYIIRCSAWQGRSIHLVLGKMTIYLYACHVSCTLRHEAGFPSRQAICFPITAESWRSPAGLDRKIKVHNFCSRLSLLKKFYSSFFSAINSVEWYLSTSAVGNNMLCVQGKLASFLRVQRVHIRVWPLPSAKIRRWLSVRINRSTIPSASAVYVGCNIASYAINKECIFVF